MCAFVYPSDRMYLSASCVRVSIPAFVCVHARVREDVCESPSVCLSVRPSVCLRAYSCVQMFDRTCVRPSMHAFVYLRGGICLSPSVLPSVRSSVCLSPCIFVHPNVCSHMRAFINACATFLISNL